MNVAREAHLLRSLLDISFTELITPKLARLVYVLALAGIAVWDIWLVINALDQSLLSGLGTLLVVALATVFAAIVVRVTLEVAVILFRIADNTSETAEHGAQIAMNTTSGPRDDRTARRPAGAGSIGRRDPSNAT